MNVKFEAIRKAGGKKVNVEMIPYQLGIHTDIFFKITEPDTGKSKKIKLCSFLRGYNRIFKNEEIGGK